MGLKKSQDMTELDWTGLACSGLHWIEMEAIQTNLIVLIIVQERLYYNFATQGYESQLKVVYLPHYRI